MKKNLLLKLNLQELAKDQIHELEKIKGGSEWPPCHPGHEYQGRSGGCPTDKCDKTFAN